MGYAPAPEDASSLKRKLLGNPTDRVLLALALIGIGFCWQFIHARLAAGEPMVAIYHGRTLLARYPLHVRQPVHYTALGDLGPAEIEIDRQGVHFTDSPCHGKNCIRAGHKHQIGDVIACVPNRILVAINGARNSGTGFDAVAE